ncbi:MAG: hypothetical protein HQL36_11310, partial [Alphaproteobacteria bacterium]|nr:hypothetical protein [Alphaproteobacteria bacterium]
MTPLHWSSLGAATAMVAVVIGAALKQPVSDGAFAARASFAFAAPAAVPENRTARTQSPISAPSPTPEELALFETVSNGPDYDLGPILSGDAAVPRLTISRIPGFLPYVRETAERKALFFKTLLPLVMQANESIT